MKNPSGDDHRPPPFSAYKFHKSDVSNLNSWFRSTIPFKSSRRGQKPLNSLSDYHRSHQSQKQSSPVRWSTSIASVSNLIGIYLIIPNLGFSLHRWLLTRLLIPEHRKNGRKKRIKAKRSERGRCHVSIRRNMGVAVRWGKARDRRSKPGVDGMGLFPQSRQKGVKMRGSDRLGAKFSIFRWGCDHQSRSWMADSIDGNLVVCFQFEVGLGWFYDLVLALVWSRYLLQFLIWRLIKTMERLLNEMACGRKCCLLAIAACLCNGCCYLVVSFNRFVGWVSHIFSLLVYYIGYINLVCIWNYVCNFADPLFGVRNLGFYFISISVKPNEKDSVSNTWSSEVLTSKSLPYSSLGPHITPKSHCSKHIDVIYFDNT